MNGIAVAGRTKKVALTILFVQLCASGGCTSMRVAMDGLARRGEAIQEVHQSRAEYRSDMHEQRLAQKLAEIDDHLRQLNQLNCTKTETTLAMEMSQSLDIQDISVDVEELKNVIARAEARARAEQLRRERLPGLLREQREAFGGESLGVNDEPRRFQQVAYDGSVMPAADEADIVVGVDQCGKPLPFAEDSGPAIAPSEIPYVVRMRINVGLENPRLEKSKVRRHPGCGLPDCYGKGCSKCALAPTLDGQRYAAVPTFEAGDPAVAGYRRVVESWRQEMGGSPLDPSQPFPPANDETRIATRRLPATGWPGTPASRNDPSPYSLPEPARTAPSGAAPGDGDSAGSNNLMPVVIR